MDSFSSGVLCSLHGEHHLSICVRLRSTENCLSSYHHSRTRGPNLYVDAMLVVWSGMAILYTFPHSRCCWLFSQDLQIPQLDCSSVPDASTMVPRLIEQSGCPPIPMGGHPILNQEVRMPGGDVETRHN